MSALPPLRVVLFRHLEDVDVVPLEEAAVHAFQGGKQPGTYVISGADLGIQLEVFNDGPSLEAAEFLDAFCHTLVLVFVDREFLNARTALYDWLAACFAHTSVSNGRHSMLVLSMEERLGQRFAEKPGLAGCQVAPVQTFGERAIRPAMIALRALHEARLLLAAGMPSHATGASKPVGFLRFFISHAKLDGLPLAMALRHQIQATGWLRTFYDADDLPPGCNWRDELERGVGDSLIIMLRTEAYDGRYWCQQEVMWSDEYATPAVLVEARTGLDHPAGTLPFDRIPTARIPDGNLMRVLYLAVREGLRFLLFARHVEELKLVNGLPTGPNLRAFSIRPSMGALLRACRALANVPGPRYILYPDPVLGSGAYEAARALVDSEAPGTILATPNTLIAATV